MSQLWRRSANLRTALRYLLVETAEITATFRDAKIASNRDRWTAVIATLSAAPVIALGFLPTSHDLYKLFARVLPIRSMYAPWVAELCFPLLALFFHLSIWRRRAGLPAPIDGKKLIQISLLPLAIAFGFGWVRGGLSLFSSRSVITIMQIAWWNLICVPLGEELIFRGWFYNLIEKIFPRKMFTATNPLPISVWMSAFAFSLWHWQNAATEPLGFVLFQVAYTFVTGIWLGYIRWRTDRLAPSIVAHALLNFFSLVI